MPRKPDGDAAMSGAERIRRYRDRKREAGFVQIWATTGQEIPSLKPHEAASIIEHWDRLVRELQAVQRAAREREAWLDRISVRTDPEHHLFAQAAGDERAAQQLDLITDTDLRTIRSSRRPRPQHLSRAARWSGAVSDLRELISDYEQWLGNLPDSISDSGGPLVEKLEAIVALSHQVEELEAADLPLGWGRD